MRNDKGNRLFYLKAGYTESEHGRSAQSYVTKKGYAFGRESD
jgi:hypothetical protein